MHESTKWFSYTPQTPRVHFTLFGRILASICVLICIPGTRHRQYHPSARCSAPSNMGWPGALVLYSVVQGCPYFTNKYTAKGWESEANMMKRFKQISNASYMRTTTHTSARQRRDWRQGPSAYWAEIHLHLRDAPQPEPSTLPERARKWAISSHDKGI